jgi:hypothetical protein
MHLIFTFHFTLVVQRLSDFRVPVGTEIQLRFSRKVRIDGMEDETVIATESPSPSQPIHVPAPASVYHVSLSNTYCY